MKKMRLTSLLLAILTVALCFASCGGAADPNNGGNASVDTGDGKANHIGVNIKVFTETEAGSFKKLDAPKMLFGVRDGETISIGYDDGETVTVKTVLKKLASARQKAEVTFGKDSDGIENNIIESIKYNNKNYAPGAQIDKTTVHTLTKDDGTSIKVHYYEMKSWEWTHNGKVVTSVDDLVISEGDVLVLTLKYSLNTNEYVLAESENNAEADS